MRLTLALVIARCAGLVPTLASPRARRPVQICELAKRDGKARRPRGPFKWLAGWSERKQRRLLREEPGVAPAKGSPLSLSEELQLMTLGYTRAEAQAMEVNEARSVLASRTMPSRMSPTSQNDDPSDDELFQAALREVKAMRKFARGELDRSPPPPMTEAEVNATLSRSWPDLPTFTKLITTEALFRLRILGPAFAEPLKEESRMRRNIYRAWLDFVDGVGLFPDTAGSFFEPNGGPTSELVDDQVERVYDDLKRRRNEVRLFRAQFDDWERKAVSELTTNFTKIAAASRLFATSSIPTTRLTKKLASQLDLNYILCCLNAPRVLFRAVCHFGFVPYQLAKNAPLRLGPDYINGTLRVNLLRNWLLKFMVLRFAGVSVSAKHKKHCAADYFVR